MQNWPQRLENGLFLKSRSMAPPWGPLLRLMRYPAAIARDWLAGEMNVRAMSLAYTTLLSIVPLLVFSFSILKAIGARGDLRYILHEFFRPMGGADAQLTDSVMQFVTNMRGDVLGILGLASLVYTVIATIQKVEASFNFVWRIERPRSLARRVVEYLAVMILGPVLLAAVVGLLGSAEHSPFGEWLNAVPLLGVPLELLGRFVPYAIVTVVFTFMYAFVPNTRVEFRAALLGGVTAGIMWALVGRVFAAVIVYSSQMLAVYTGFAVVLTTLIWVWLSWLILLIGAQLAFYVQCPQYLRHGQEAIALTGSARELAGLSVMYLLGRSHGAGAPKWTDGGLAVELDIPSSALAPVLKSLERGGLMIATENKLLLPARDPAAIQLVDVLHAVRSQPPGRSTIDMRCVPPASLLMTEVEAAIRERLGAMSLKDWIAVVPSRLPS
jgi:membrane protein